MRLPDLAAAHPRIDLDEPRTARRHLALHVEDAALEAAAFEGRDREVAELRLVALREQRRADAPRLREIRLRGRAVVDDARVRGLAPRDHHVDVDLGPVEVLLHQEVDGLLVGVGGFQRVLLDERAGRHDGVAHLREHVRVALVEVRARFDFFHAERRRAVQRLEHRREPHDVGGGVEVGGGRDAVARGRREARGLHRGARPVLVARGVDRGRRRARQTERLREARDQRHGELAEGADARGHLRQAADGVDAVREDRLRVSLEVERDELRDDALGDHALGPGARLVDDDGPDA
mmetsp:Transcript_31461/g.97350  ORF Transcript_31461/g.97350 Transcript_31461/m.97350 type:complete len:293 (+) Transcript_31461:996-1874(+)